AAMASTPRGDAIAVWTRSAADDRARLISESVWAARFAPDSGWSEPAQIDRPGAANSHLPRIALSADGTALAVWETHTADTIWGNLYRPQTGWQGPKPLDQGGPDLVDAPRVGADARGRFTLSWRRYRKADTSLWVRQYQPGSGWHYPQKVTDSLDGQVRDHRLAVTDDGTAVSLWVQGVGDTGHVYASRHTPGLGWQAPVAVQRDPDTESALPSLAISPHGDAIAVWMQRRASSQTAWQVHASQFRSQRWGTPAPLARDGEGGYPRAAIDTNGNALVAWSRVDDAGASVWVRRYSARSGWSHAHAITPRSAMLAALVVDPGGRALAIGQRQDAHGQMRVWANRFE
ncbi:MAG: hypothetical protein AAF460_11305, partial [Pseudomonadota bacterium]